LNWDATEDVMRSIHAIGVTGNRLKQMEIFLIGVDHHDNVQVFGKNRFHVSRRRHSSN